MNIVGIRAGSGAAGLATATSPGLAKAQPRWIISPRGWDDTWQTAKAAQATTPAWISFIGTSITAGQGSTDWIPNGYVGKLKTSLIAAGNTLYADYYPICYTSTLNSTVGASTPWSAIKAAQAHAEYQAGFNLAEGVTTTASADQYTFTSPYACTRMDLWCIDYASGTFDVKIDGGAAQTTTNTGPGTPAGATVKKVSFTSLANTTHTLSIGNSNGGNVIMILGVSCFASTTAGIGFARMGLPGLAAVNLATPVGAATGSSGVGSWPTDKIGLHSGSAVAGFPTQPALAVIELSVNDATYGMNVESYRYAIGRLIQSLRKGYLNCSIVFVLPSYPYNQYADSNIGGRPYHHLRIKATVEAMAAQFCCAVVDIDTKWGETPFGQGFLTNNDIHPTDAGHADIAAVLATIV